MNNRSYQQKIILRDIVEEINKSGFQSFSADEVTSRNDEILSLCFRCVDENMESQKKLATFLDLERLIEEYVSAMCNGNGAVSAMTVPKYTIRKECGCQFVLNESENFVVTHFCMHNLDL